MLQIVLFRVWLNIQFPRLAIAIAPIIDKLLEEEKRAAAGKPPVHAGYEELYRVAFGLPFTRKT